LQSAGEKPRFLCDQCAARVEWLWQQRSGHRFNANATPSYHLAEVRPLDHLKTVGDWAGERTFGVAVKDGDDGFRNINQAADGSFLS